MTAENENGVSCVSLFAIIRADSFRLTLILNPDIYALLSERGSLTKRFQQLMGVRPRLTRLKQKRELLTPFERAELGVAPREMALVREIKMAKGDKDWLFARTIIPNSTLSGSARRIASLQDTPIGKILFGRNGAQRKCLHLDMTDQLPEGALALGIEVAHPLWRRRSIFEFPTGPILITELFLPDCPIYTDGQFENR